MVFVALAKGKIRVGILTVDINLKYGINEKKNVPLFNGFRVLSSINNTLSIMTRRKNSC